MSERFVVARSEDASWGIVDLNEAKFSDFDSSVPAVYDCLLAAVISECEGCSWTSCESAGIDIGMLRFLYGWKKEAAK